MTEEPEDPPEEDASQRPSEDAGTDQDVDAAPGEATVPPSERAEDLEAEINGLEERVRELEQEHTELAEEIEHRTEALARVQADYENFRERAKRERREAARRGQAEVLEVFAAFLDDVERALGAGGSAEGVRKGLEMVMRNVDQRLADLGVETIEPAPGDAVDPDRHEVLETVASDEHAEGEVAELIRPGYRLEERLVRPATVKAAAAEDEAPSDDDGQA